MTRRQFTFSCKGIILAGAVDLAPATTGLLIVSGGNEVRSGPWASQALLAERIAAAGFPVLRFDRRGVGDSAGHNTGFTGSADDIAAACRAFRAHVPTLKRIVVFGNCDGASALMLAGGAGIDALVLANPWTFAPEAEPDAPTASQLAESKLADPEPTPMPPSVLRRHYLKRLTDPRAVWRLLTGKVQIGKLAGSLADAAKGDAPPSLLARQMADGIAEFSGPVTILLAERDRTAQAFRANWDKADPRLRTCPDATHSFVEPQARIWLQGQLLAALRALG